ncbi:hypothetical protein I3842_10G065500 [Carya illinoinensis]|uniref:Protein argonaute 2 n=1 Tax=Carya illinoinensis TaxID=32201 RepID=A0A922DVW3_CARIL|nr:hypothetical protein I3842_10G065500 [Carya illinoinensis]
MERGGWNRGRGRGRDGGGRGGRGGHQQHQQWRGSRPGGPWDRQQQQPQGVGIVASGPPMGQVVEPASWGRSGEGSSSAAGRGGRGPAWRGGAGQLQWVGAGSPTPTAAAPPVQRPPPISPEPIPDPVVREMQSMSISENLTTPPEDSKRILPVKRPDKGGALAVRTSRLRVNHFPINFTPETVIMHYDLDVKLEVPLKNRRPVRISKADLSVVRSKLSSDDPVRFPLTKTAYDGEKNIFSAVLLPTGKFNVHVPEGEDAKGGSYVVTIKLVNELKLCKLKDYLSGYLSSIPRDILQGLDLVMKENPARNMVSVGRSFFPREPREGDDLGWGIMAFRGFQHSLKPTSQGLAMCLDYSVLAFRKPFPVIDFLRERISQFDILNFQRFRAAVVEELKDLKVTVTHRKTKQKYIIKGLTSENTRRISFDEEDPEGKNPTRKVSIVDYFRVKYGKDIGYKDIPCLDLGRGNKKNYVPMEFCILVEGQRFPKEDLDRNAAIMLKNMSLVRPNDREREICSMVRSKDGPLGGGMAQNFGMEVNMNMTKVTGRIIGPPELKLGASNGKTIKVMVEREKCQWNLVGKSVVEGKSIGRWGVIDFSSSDRSRLNPDFFIPKLINRCGNLGIRMEEPLIYQCTTMSKFSRRDPGYKYLKWISETQLGIVTQCCLSTCANKANDQYLANLAIKINAKLGGSNVELNNPLPCFEGKGHVMFVGADVNHPAARNTTSPSIAAVVATMNWPAANRYVARVCPQVHRKEKILNFGDMCLELVERYAQLNNVRPDKIVIFRDGVSEGQFDMVLNEELLDLKRALQAIKYSPSITLIVAQKRHQTRFFPESARDGCSTGNVSPGTVVDTIIVHPFEFDFYLCSHFGSLGTSKPTHYHVLWDEHRFTSDQLQKLIYELCFTFARCTKPVSLVPPVYYADLVAYRGRLYYEAMVEGRFPASTSSASSSSSSSLASFDLNSFKLHAALENIMFFV